MVSALQRESRVSNLRHRDHRCDTAVVTGRLTAKIVITSNAPQRFERGWRRSCFVVVRLGSVSPMIVVEELS